MKSHLNLLILIIILLSTSGCGIFDAIKGDNGLFGGGEVETKTISGTFSDDTMSEMRSLASIADSALSSAFEEVSSQAGAIPSATSDTAIPSYLKASEASEESISVIFIGISDSVSGIFDLIANSDECMKVTATVSSDGSFSADLCANLSYSMIVTVGEFVVDFAFSINFSIFESLDSFDFGELILLDGAFYPKSEDISSQFESIAANITFDHDVTGVYDATLDYAEASIFGLDKAGTYIEEQTYMLVHDQDNKKLYLKTEDNDAPLEAELIPTSSNCFKANYNSKSSMQECSMEQTISLKLCVVTDETEAAALKNIESESDISTLEGEVTVFNYTLGDNCDKTLAGMFDITYYTTGITLTIVDGSNEILDNALNALTAGDDKDSEHTTQNVVFYLEKDNTFGTYEYGNCESTEDDLLAMFVSDVADVKTALNNGEKVPVQISIEKASGTTYINALDTGEKLSLPQYDYGSYFYDDSGDFYRSYSTYDYTNILGQVSTSVYIYLSDSTYNCSSWISATTDSTSQNASDEGANASQLANSVKYEFEFDGNYCSWNSYAYDATSSDYTNVLGKSELSAFKVDVSVVSAEEVEIKIKKSDGTAVHTISAYDYYGYGSFDGSVTIGNNANLSAYFSYYNSGSYEYIYVSLYYYNYNNGASISLYNGLGESAEYYICSDESATDIIFGSDSNDSATGAAGTNNSGSSSRSFSKSFSSDSITTYGNCTDNDYVNSFLGSNYSGNLNVDIDLGSGDTKVDIFNSGGSLLHSESLDNYDYGDESISRYNDAYSEISDYSSAYNYNSISVYYSTYYSDCYEYNYDNQGSYLSSDSYDNALSLSLSYYSYDPTSTDYNNYCSIYTSVCVSLE
ncbi:MAG: hypothetical protein ABIA04_12620 [Pseudomonadota bacterium]